MEARESPIENCNITIIKIDFRGRLISSKEIRNFQQIDLNEKDFLLLKDEGLVFTSNGHLVVPQPIPPFSFFDKNSSKIWSFFQLNLEPYEVTAKDGDLSIISYMNQFHLHQYKNYKWMYQCNFSELSFFTDFQSNFSSDKTNVLKLLNGSNLVLDFPGFLSITVPDGTSNGGNLRGNHAIDFQKIRKSESEVANGDYSFIAGGQQNSTKGENGFVFGKGCSAGKNGFSGGFFTESSGETSFSFGSKFGSESIFNAISPNSIVFGLSNNGTIKTIDEANGGISGGHASEFGEIKTSGDGSVSYGRTSMNGIIEVKGQGAYAFGYAIDDGKINVSSNGSFSSGYAKGRGSELSSSDGCVQGYALDGGKIHSSGKGSFSGGYAEKNGHINSSGKGSFSFGMATQSHSVNGDGSHIFGKNNQINGDYSAITSGNQNIVNASNSSIIGGSGFETDKEPKMKLEQDETALTQRLRIRGGIQIQVERLLNLNYGSNIKNLGLDDYLIVIPNNNPTTINLPVDPILGQEYHIKVCVYGVQLGLKEMLVSGNGHKLCFLDGSRISSVKLVNGHSLRLVYDGVEWQII